MTLALLTAHNASGASLAATAIVRVEPPAMALALGCRSGVDIQIADVSGLYGADVRLSFDPAILQVVDGSPDEPGIQVTLGPLLTSYDYFVAINAADNSVGTVRVVLTQMNPAPPAEGTGVLMHIDFVSVGLGDSALHITYSQLSTRLGGGIANTRQDGVISSGQEGACGPTPTITKTSVATATQTRAVTATRTRTRTSQPTTIATSTSTRPAVTGTATRTRTVTPSPASTGQATASATSTIAAGPTASTIFLPLIVLDAPVEPTPTETETTPVQATPTVTYTPSSSLTPQPPATATPIAQTTPGGIALIPVDGANWLTVDPGTGAVFVSNRLDGIVAALQGADLMAMGSVAVGSQPFGLAVHSNLGLLYVANYGSGTVSVVSIARMRVLATYMTGGGPTFIALDQQSGDVFVPLHPTNLITRFRNGQYLGKFAVRSDQVFSIALDSGASPRRLYIGTRSRYGDLLVYAVEDAALRYVATLNPGGTIYNVSVDNETGYVYVMHTLTNDSNARYLTIYDRAGRKLTPQAIDVGGNTFDGGAVVAARSGRVYVAATECIADGTQDCASYGPSGSLRILQGVPPVAVTAITQPTIAPGVFGIAVDDARAGRVYMTSKGDWGWLAAANESFLAPLGPRQDADVSWDLAGRMRSLLQFIRRAFGG